MSQKENAGKVSPSSPPANASFPPAAKKVALIGAQFVGPLPPPEAFQRYEEILLGAAERILKMAEKQAEHRQRLEEKIVNAEIRDARLGLIFGFLIGLTTIVGGVICVLQGAALPGTFLSLWGLTSLVGAFIYGSRQRRQREEK